MTTNNFFYDTNIENDLFACFEDDSVLTPGNPMTREEIEANMTPLAKTHIAFNDVIDEDRYESYGIIATDKELAIGTIITDDVTVFTIPFSGLDLALERAEEMNKKNIYLVGTCNHRGIPAKDRPNCCEYGREIFVAYTKVLAKAFK